MPLSEFALQGYNPPVSRMYWQRRPNPTVAEPQAQVYRNQDRLVPQSRASQGQIGPTNSSYQAQERGCTRIAGNQSDAPCTLFTQPTLPRPLSWCYHTKSESFLMVRTQTSVCSTPACAPR